jgi:hypothetical protein
LLLAKLSSVGIQERTYLARKSQHAERLADEVELWFQNSMMDDGVLGIARTVENFEA